MIFLEKIQWLFSPKKRAELAQQRIYESWESCFEQFVKLLFVLSATAEKQIQAMGYGNVGYEMAEDFSRFYPEDREGYLKYDLINKRQAEQLDLLAKEFEENDKIPDFYFFVNFPQNLYNHPNWERIREQSSRCIQSLNAEKWRLVSEVKNETIEKGDLKGGLSQKITWTLEKNKKLT